MYKGEKIRKIIASSLLASVLATYRYIHYGKDGLLLIEDFDLYGPKLGVVFHF